MPTFISSTPSVSAPVSFEVLYAKMLPHFRRYARRFDKSRRFGQDDVIQELAGIAFEMYTSLIQRGKETFYSPIVRFSIQKFHRGRRFVGMNSTDILSEHTQMQKRCGVFSLDEAEEGDNRYFMTDQKTNVADYVQFRLDFEDWLQRQTERDQAIIRDLAMSETTGDVAKKYKVSAGLISQYRKRYADSWNAFITDKRESA